MFPITRYTLPPPTAPVFAAAIKKPAFELAAVWKSNTRPLPLLYLNHTEMLKAEPPNAVVVPKLM
jgi:hypothetical protein